MRRLNSRGSRRGPVGLRAGALGVRRADVEAPFSPATFIAGGRSLDASAIIPGTATTYSDQGVTPAVNAGNVGRLLDAADTSRHASQTSTALQPVLGRAPQTRRNIILNSNNVSGAGWSTNNATTAVNSTTAPDGTPTADVVTFLAQYGQLRQPDTTVTGGNAATISMWLRRISGNSSMHIRGTVTGDFYLGAPVTITDQWARYSATYTHDGTRAVYWTLQDRNPSGWGQVAIWGAQLEIGGTVTPYQKVGTSLLDITEGGVSYNYLRFDAVDDQLSQTYTNAQTGDLMIFGRKASRIVPGYTVGAGGTVNIINGSTTAGGGTTSALGDIIGWYHAPRTLTAAEQTQLMDHYTPRGAGALV